MKAAVVDWLRFQQCDGCGAGLGKPCRVLTGYVAGAQGGPVEVEADRPHGGRKERAGAVR